MPAWRPIEQVPADVPDGTIATGLDLELQATSADGQHRWIARRRGRLSGYDTPGPGGLVITEHATMVDHHLVGSADGGQTWFAVARSGTTGIAFDRRGQVWLGWHGGVDVADARAALAGTDGAWRHVMDRGATCIAVDGNDRVIAGTGGGGWMCSDGARFEALPDRAREQGAWGSLEVSAGGFRALRRAPDGAVWGVIDGYIVRLDPAEGCWRSVNLGLTVFAGKGARRESVEVTALSFGPDGAAYCSTRSQGNFCRPRRAQASLAL